MEFFNNDVKYERWCKSDIKSVSKHCSIEAYILIVRYIFITWFWGQNQNLILKQGSAY